MLPTGAVGRIIGKKGNKVRNLQTKNNVSITITKPTEDNQKLTIKGSIPNIQIAIDEIKQIIQCKYSNTCTFGLNCKFNYEQLNIVEFYKGVLPQDRSEINKNPNTAKQENTIHFNIEDTQKKRTNKPDKRPATDSDRKPDQRNFTKRVNKINKTKINNTTLNQTFSSIRNNIENQKQTKRTRRSMNRKPTKNKLKILYSNARGIKSKMKSLKEIVYSTECDLYSVTEMNLKQNENIVVKGYKWVGKIREKRNGGGNGILIKDTLINDITIEPITAKNIEVLLLKLNLNNSEYLVIMIYYGKQESRTNKEEAIAEFKNIEIIIECQQNQQYHTLLIRDFNAKIGSDEKGIQNGDKQVSRNGIMLRDLIEKYDLTVVNNEPICSGK